MILTYDHQYGFAKIRRGAELDAYAHESFVRDQPHTLVLLRKLSSRRKPSKDSWITRPVSPATTNTVTSDEGSPMLGSRQMMWNHSPSPQHDDRGRLDLLALALEREAQLR